MGAGRADVVVAEPLLSSAVVERGDQRHLQACLTPSATSAGSYTSPGPKQAVAAVAVRLSLKARADGSSGKRGSSSRSSPLLESALEAVAARAAGPLRSASINSRTRLGVAVPLKKTEALMPRAVYVHVRFWASGS